MPSARAPLIVACIAAGLVAACGSPRAELAPEELDQAARQLASISSEAALLAGQLAGRAVTRNFAWVHQQALVDEAQQAARTLFKPVSPALRPRHERLVLLAARLEMTVDGIAPLAADRLQLAQLQRTLEGLRAQAAALEEAP
jgi:hypothetical protein